MQATPKKSTMKKLVIAVGLLAMLNGCATITDTQATCQSSTYTFTDMVGCLNEQVRKNPSLVSNSLRAEYMAYANTLVDQVSYGKLSDANARYMLAEKLSDVQARHDVSRRAALSQALLAQQPSQPMANAYQPIVPTYRPAPTYQPIQPIVPAYRPPTVTTTTCRPGLLAGTMNCRTY